MEIFIHREKFKRLSGFLAESSHGFCHNIQLTLLVDKKLIIKVKGSHAKLDFPRRVRSPRNFDTKFKKFRYPSERREKKVVPLIPNNQHQLFFLPLGHSA